MREFNEYEGRFGDDRSVPTFSGTTLPSSRTQTGREQFRSLDRVEGAGRAILFRGRFKTKRPISWSAGVMYDCAAEKWVMRQTQCHHRRPGNLGSISPLAVQGRFLAQQGHDRTWRLERWSANRSTTRPFPSSPTASNGSATCRKRRSSGISVSMGTRSPKGRHSPDLRNQISGRFAWVADTLDRRRKSAPHRRERPLRQDEGRKDPAESSSGSLDSSFFLDTAEFDARHSNMTSIETYWRPHFGYRGCGTFSRASTRRIRATRSSMARKRS